MRILVVLTRYGQSGEGDVKQLTDREGLCRLRVGKWRVFFDRDTPGAARIHGIDNRGQAYRCAVGISTWSHALIDALWECAPYREISKTCLNNIC
jgi:hypothetical protein